MKNTKKLLALALAAVLCFGMLMTGCGSKGGGGAAGGGQTSAGGEQASKPADGDKDEIVIGYVGPFTGPLSCFTVAFDWVSEQALEKINAEGGIYIESYGKKLPVRIVKADTESNPTTASEVANKLVLNEKVDILVGAWTPDNTVPVSSVAEKNHIPCLLSNSPAESWQAGGTYEWSYGMMFSVEDIVKSYADALDKLETNKKVGFLFDSEVDGVTFSGYLQKELEGRGYTIVDPGRFASSTTDYTTIISQLKDAGCDIVCGNQTLPNFTTAWQQFNQLGYVPKAMVMGKAIAYGSDVEALGGDLGNGLLTEIHWDRSYPYTSSLLGLSAEELAQKWEDEKQSQYPACSFGYDVSLFEVLNIALSNCKDLNPETIRDAIAAVDYEGIYGKLSFNGTHVMKCPITTGQWLKGEKWPYEATVVGSGSYPIIEAGQPVILENTTMK